MKKTYLTLLFGFIPFFLIAQTEFITTWKTDNPGASADNQITVPTFPGGTYNYTVDWGDGSSEVNVTETITHTYDIPGTYRVAITGDFPHIYFGNQDLNTFQGDEEKLLEVNQWGNIVWESMFAAFAGCKNLDVIAQDIPNLANVSSFTLMFWNCNSLIGTTTFELWDTSNISEAANMFRRAELFNQNIGNWDVSNFINMGAMFIDAKAFNQNLNTWDVSKVTQMQTMFAGASDFNGDISNWDVSNVTNMAGMFNRTSFNQDISSWNVAQVVFMNSMFSSNTVFNQDIRSWNVSNVTSMARMFLMNSSFDYNIGGWDISKVTDMTDMFAQSTGLSYDNYNNILIGWSNLPSVQANVRFDSTYHEYCSAESARQDLIDIYGWTINDNGKNCIDGQRPFITSWKTDNFGDSDDNQLLISTSQFGIYQYNVDWGDGTTDNNVRRDILHTYSTPGIYSVQISGYYPSTGFFTSQKLDREKLLTIDQWGDIVWENLNFGFSECINMNVVATDTPDLSKVEQLSGTFERCHSLVGNSSFNNWDVSNVDWFSSLFGVCYEFNQDISNWDMSKAQTIRGMFNFATSFNQDISSWDVSNVVFMGSVFNSAHDFNQDISGWDVSKVTDMYGMFRNARSYNQSMASWDIASVTDMSEMFFEAGISRKNYDETLTGWSSLPNLQRDVSFDAGRSQYCEAAEERQSIIENFQWIITDSGEFPFCNQSTTALKAYVLTPSCVGSSDGSIAIISDVLGYLLDISIEGEGVSEEFTDINSGTPFKISDLSVGFYTVTVSIPDILFEQTYGLKINELGSVSGKRTLINPKAGTVSYKVSGNKFYKVSVNGVQQTFSFNKAGEETILLNNLKGQIEVTISGDSDCQGSIIDSFYIGEDIRVYPTITSAQVNLLAEGAKLNVRLYSLDGRLLKKQTFNQLENNLDISTFESGLYFLEIESAERKKTIKIVKI